MPAAAARSLECWPQLPESPRECMMHNRHNRISKRASAVTTQAPGARWSAARIAKQTGSSAGRTSRGQPADCSSQPLCTRQAAPARTAAARRWSSP
eukprot:6196861-Pleurochrysis_carterae.AAC.3